MLFSNALQLQKIWALGASIHAARFKSTTHYLPAAGYNLEQLSGCSSLPQQPDPTPAPAQHSQ